MVNVLIIAFYFPPEGGPAVQRVSKFVKYLPEYGYNPIVLTSKHPFRVKDCDLMQELPVTQVIYHVIDWVAYLQGEIVKYVKKWLYPDKHCMWVKPATIKALKIIKKHDIKIIFTSSPPHSSQQIAYQVAQRLTIPFIIDLRDEWSANPDFAKWNNPEKQRNLEKKLLSKAAYITTICHGAAGRLSNIINKDNVEVIFNGFDKEDYPQSPVKNINEKIVFAYGGRLSDKTSPTTFFKALNDLAFSNEIDQDTLKVNIWGTNNKEHWLNKDDYSFKVCDFMGYLSHRKYINAIMNADVLLLFVTKIKESDILTGKVFEYILFNKPILAIIEKDCELNQILQEYGNAYICYNNDLNNIKATIQGLLELWKKDDLTKAINSDFINKFDRRMQTRQLAELFTKCIKR